MERVFPEASSRPLLAGARADDGRAQPDSAGGGAGGAEAAAGHQALLAAAALLFVFGYVRCTDVAGQGAGAAQHERGVHAARARGAALQGGAPAGGVRSEGGRGAAHRADLHQHQPPLRPRGRPDDGRTSRLGPVKCGTAGHPEGREAVQVQGSGGGRHFGGAADGALRPLPEAPRQDASMADEQPQGGVRAAGEGHTHALLLQPAPREPARGHRRLTGASHVSLLRSRARSPPSTRASRTSPGPPSSHKCEPRLSSCESKPAVARECVQALRCEQQLYEPT
eukprot:1194300-Prorocentrum_minimum.AAC.4